MVIDTGINYDLTAGTSVGLQPTYQWNAKVTSGTIQIYDAEGNAVADSYTSEGDHITILSICPREYTQLSLALIQFPDQSNSCYIQGYIQTSDFSAKIFHLFNCCYSVCTWLFLILGKRE